MIQLYGLRSYRHTVRQMKALGPLLLMNFCMTLISFLQKFNELINFVKNKQIFII